MRTLKSYKLLDEVILLIEKGSKREGRSATNFIEHLVIEDDKRNKPSKANKIK
jgi:hypothetical protein